MYMYPLFVCMQKFHFARSCICNSLDNNLSELQMRFLGYLLSSVSYIPVFVCHLELQMNMCSIQANDKVFINTHIHTHDANKNKTKKKDIQAIG